GEGARAGAVRVHLEPLPRHERADAGVQLLLLHGAPAELPEEGIESLPEVVAGRGRRVPVEAADETLVESVAGSVAGFLDRRRGRLRAQLPDEGAAQRDEGSGRDADISVRFHGSPGFE